MNDTHSHTHTYVHIFTPLVLPNDLLKITIQKTSIWYIYTNEQSKITIDKKKPFVNKSENEKMKKKFVNNNIIIAIDYYLCCN